jgi:hypothetical protein
MSVERDSAVRSLLVEQVVAVTRRGRWRLPLLGIGAFAVAGALTAGAVVGSGLLQQDVDPQDAAVLATSGIAPPVSFVGSPVVRVADGPTSLTLPERPEGASVLVVGGQCGAPRTIRVSVSGGADTVLECGSPAAVVAAPATGSGAPTSLSFLPSDRGGSTVWASWARPAPMPAASQQQRDETEDGVVTRSEYLAAWNRYLGCMRALGHPIGQVAQSATVLSYGIPGAALDANDRCSAAEFQDVDTTWQSEHPLDADGVPTMGLEYVPARDDPRYAG